MNFSHCLCVVYGLSISNLSLLLSHQSPHLLHLQRTDIAIFVYLSYLRIPSASYRCIRARKIYSKYLHPLSIIPVPITQALRATILKNLENSGPALFKQAHEDVLNYIELCQFSTFMASPEWDEVKTLLEKRKKKECDSLHRFSVCIDNAGDARSLRGVLNNQLSTRYFKDFCHRIFVNESLFFWLDVENYSSLPGNDYMRRAAYKICRKYIFDNAKQQINISHTTRAAVLRCVNNPDKSLFKVAQQEIFKLLELDAWPKFLKGPEYQAMLEAMKVLATGGRESEEPVVGALQRAMTRIIGGSSAT